MQWEAKNMFKKVKNAVLNYTEAEAKVRDATNSEPWGASSTLMQEIAQMTFRHDEFQQVMSTIFKRLGASQKNWRNVYKALSLLEYILKHGSERVIEYSRDHIYSLKSLKNFSFVDEKRKDQVRKRSSEIVNLLNDRTLLDKERNIARENKDKYIGTSSYSHHSQTNYSSHSQEYSQSNPTDYQSHNTADIESEDSDILEFERQLQQESLAAKNLTIDQPKKSISTNELLLVDFDEPLASVKSTGDMDVFTDFQSASKASSVPLADQKPLPEEDFADFTSAPIKKKSKPKNSKRESQTKIETFKSTQKELSYSISQASLPDKEQELREFEESLAQTKQETRHNDKGNDFDFATLDFDTIAVASIPKVESEEDFADFTSAPIKKVSKTVNEETITEPNILDDFDSFKGSVTTEIAVPPENDFSMMSVEDFPNFKASNPDVSHAEEQKTTSVNVYNSLYDEPLHDDEFSEFKSSNEQLPKSQNLGNISTFENPWG